MSQLYLNTSVHYKAINRCIDVSECWVSNRAGKNGVKSRLPGIRKIFKLDKDGKILP